jgi:hypothetical protein
MFIYVSVFQEQLVKETVLIFLIGCSVTFLSNHTYNVFLMPSLSNISQ